MIKRRDIVTAILLTLVTCGIYGIFWFIAITDETKLLTKSTRLTSGGTAFLLSLVTCGIYSYIWAYNMGKSLSEYKQTKGQMAEDQSILFLILQLVGLSIVTYCLVQQTLNEEVQATEVVA